MRDLPKPAPFKVRLAPAILHVRGGTVDQPGHPLHGRPAYVSQRGASAAGEVTVEISPLSEHDYLQGYAQLSGPAVLESPSAARVTRVATPYPELAALWASEDHHYRRVVTHGEAEVDSLAARYGVRLPADFRQYLLHQCQTVDDGGEMDGFGNAWWGLDRIRSLREECSESHFTGPTPPETASTAILFADKMIWCWAWGIFCGEGPDFGRVFVASDRIVADSFTEFVSQYVRGDH
jgi:hypothetical protein